MIAMRCRNGFTLVELLVVCGLIAAFLGLLIAGLRPNEDTEVRAAVQNVVSALLQGQTLALQNPSGAGLLLRTVVVPTGSGSASVATSLSFTASQPPILATGTSLLVGGSTAVTGIPSIESSASLSGTQATVGFAPPLNADGVSDGYRIRFATSFSGSVAPAAFGPWFGFEPALGGSLSGIVRFTPSNGQSLANTVWPVAILPMQLMCEIARRPESTATAASFAKGAVIDMRYSGIGDDPYGPCSSFHPAAAGPLGDVALEFGGTGGLQSILPVGTSGKSSSDPSRAPAKPTAPLYLLVTPRSLIDADASSLRTDKSVWVAISPLTGRVLTGKNTPQSAPPPTLAGSGNTKEGYTLAYRTYFQNARQQVSRLSDNPPK